MKKHIKAILFAIPMSFLIGAWWGLSDNGQREVFFQTPSIRVLAAKKFFTPEVLAIIERNLKSKIVITEYEIGELHDIDPTLFDVIQVQTFNVDQFKNLTFRKSPEVLTSTVSADFNLNIKDGIFPLSWGYLAFLIHPSVSQKEPQLSDLLEEKSYHKKIHLNDSPYSMIDTLETLYPNMELGSDDFDEKEIVDRYKEIKATLYTGTLSLEEAFEKKEVLIAEVFSQDMKYFSEGDLHFLKDKTMLWVTFVGSPEETQNTDLADLFIQSLYSKEVYSELLSRNGQNSVLNGDIHNLLPTQQAQFIKNFPLNKIDIKKSLQNAQSFWDKLFNSEPVKN